MKTYFIYLLLLLGSAVYAQGSDFEIEVTKTYDKNGNLIRYDSIRKIKNDRTPTHSSHSFNIKILDSLLQGLEFIGTDRDIVIADSLFLGKGDPLNLNDFKFWIEHNGESIEIMEEDHFSQFFVLKESNERIRDSLIEKSLIKRLERIQKRLKEIEKRKQQR